MVSASEETVANYSLKVRRCGGRTFWSVFFMRRTPASHNSLKCGALTGEKCHSTGFYDQSSIILARKSVVLSNRQQFANSLAASWKSVLLLV